MRPRRLTEDPAFAPRSSQPGPAEQPPSAAGDGDGAAGDDIRYGAYAMELLVNGLLRQGADRTRLAAKVFGGASMNARLRDIGAMNGAFALKFLADEGIPCLSQSLGGTLARRIRFWPVTGQARQLLVPDQGEPAVPRERPAAPPRPAPDVTLF